MPRAVSTPGLRVSRRADDAAVPHSRPVIPAENSPAAARRPLFALRGAFSAPRRRRSRDLALTVILLLVVWQVVAGYLLAGSRTAVPPLDVARSLWDDRFLLFTNTFATVRVAVIGFAVGNVAACALAVLFVLSRTAELLLAQFTVALYALPTLVLAPILTFLLGPDNTKITVAALVVFFPTLISATTGLRSPNRETLDLVRSLGGSRWTALVKVRVRWALPTVCGGLRVAVPGALLGAITSEWLGADAGLGVFMVNALGYLNTPRVWASCVVCVAVTLTGYAAVGLLNKLVNGWYRAGTGQEAQ